ncbi:uncharacterized protein LOC127659793 [Xyrauchen texanus]|uniref:uncharacterized protein LOC127659793 n=1 Tax=Xyrauchen texanus TaxID=154827 RepID=UPI00224197B8|nr:uncharacterized protein LOC127659793 [Xyrauchen texanus]
MEALLGNNQYHVFITIAYAPSHSRRREIVEAELPVKTLKERWPALFTERQVFAEFNRIAATNLNSDFFGAIDRYTPRFLAIFKSKKGSVGEKLAEIVQQIDSRKPDVTAVRTLVLQGISVLLGDDSSTFYSTCFDSDSNEAWAQVSVGLLTVISEDRPSLQIISILTRCLLPSFWKEVFIPPGYDALSALITAYACLKADQIIETLLDPTTS